MFCLMDTVYWNAKYILGLYAYQPCVTNAEN